MFDIKRKEIKFGDRMLTLETGKMARQATGSVVVKMGDAMMLCTVVAEKEAKEGVDFFPLTVNYQEKYYAAGRFPGGFFKRESRPSKRETLISRLIDRPIRPLFPEGFYNEVQVVCTLVSYDPEVQPDVLAMCGVSAALAISGIPFVAPIGAARVGYKDGEFILNPSVSAIVDSELDLVVAGTKDAVLMVESEAKQLSEELMLDAVVFGHNAFKSVIEAIEDFANECGKAKWTFEYKEDSDLKSQISKKISKRLVETYKTVEKRARAAQLDVIKNEIIHEYVTEESGHTKNKIAKIIKTLQADHVRGMILNEERRIDSRALDEVRKIEVELDLLPRAHGSALFTRGETQALVVTTLGTGDDEQMVDDILGVNKDSFMLHYNFPSYSVGEVGRMGAPGRREIGHGELAFRAINPVMPPKGECKHTVRVVSEITESNGSSSMATVCGASLSLMSAGVGTIAPVAGIAMGLIKEGEKFQVLSDISGDEDHLGDMDFKVAGTENGITALQMDIKIQGITPAIMKQALKQAKVGRKHILKIMNKVIDEARSEISSFAPQIQSIKIPKEKIGELIGPGGKNIKDIVEKSGAKIDILEDGTVNIAAVEAESMRIAMEMVNSVTAVPEIGREYTGKISKIMDFGMFVSMTKTMEGLVRVGDLPRNLARNMRDSFKEGDTLQVRIAGIDPKGKINLKPLIEDVDSSSADEGEDDNSEVTERKFDRSDRGNRSDRGHRSSRNDRSNRSDRDDRSDRDSRDDRSSREDRGNREDRDDRSNREDREDRGSRTDRDDRNDRDDRGDTRKPKNFKVKGRDKDVRKESGQRPEGRQKRFF